MSHLTSPLPFQLWGATLHSRLSLSLSSLSLSHSDEKMVFPFVGDNMRFILSKNSHFHSWLSTFCMLSRKNRISRRQKIEKRSMKISKRSNGLDVKSGGVTRVPLW